MFPLFPYLFAMTWWDWMEKTMAPHSSTLAWKIPWAEEPGRLQSMGSLRVGHDWTTSLCLFTFMHWRRKWQPTPVFLPGESQRRGSLVGWPLSMGSCRVGHDWSDLAAAAAMGLDATIFVHFFFNFFLLFYFILLYNTVLVLSYIDMNPPRVYMSSQYLKSKLS